MPTNDIIKVEKQILDQYIKQILSSLNRKENEIKFIKIDQTEMGITLPKIEIEFFPYAN